MTKPEVAVNDLVDFMRKDRFAKHIGVEMREAGNGKARGRMIVGPHHLNSAGTVHGGAIFSLADAVFSAASNSHGTLALAINVSVSFFKAVTDGTLMAEAREVSRNLKLATYLVEVTDEAGTAVALFQGTVYRKKDSISGAVK